jgi:hypothetical protein
MNRKIWENHLTKYTYLKYNVNLAVSGLIILIPHFEVMSSNNNYHHLITYLSSYS